MTLRDNQTTGLRDDRARDYRMTGRRDGATPADRVSRASGFLPSAPACCRKFAWFAWFAVPSLRPALVNENESSHGPHYTERDFYWLAQLRTAHQLRSLVAMAQKPAPNLLPNRRNPGQTRANQGKPDLKATPPPPMNPVGDDVTLTLHVPNKARLSSRRLVKVHGFKAPKLGSRNSLPPGIQARAPKGSLPTRPSVLD